MSYFEYGETEINHLKRRCRKLGMAIDRIGFIQRNTMPNPFEALVHSVVGQQISTSAAKTVWKRFEILVGEIKPKNIQNVDPAAIQKCGMTTRKVNYILGIAHAACSGEIDFDSLQSLSDEEIIKKLSALDGVGVWTVEMLLIHSLCRPDIISYGDLAIRRGMMNLYGLKSLNKAQFDRYRKRYIPYSSTAS
ncbi:MAG TPA: DNA-3-methyladenine glycosylase 2 family protein, partial [Bacteroidales bacterium]